MRRCARSSASNRRSRARLAAIVLGAFALLGVPASSLAQSTPVDPNWAYAGFAGSADGTVSQSGPVACSGNDGRALPAAPGQSRSFDLTDCQPGLAASASLDTRRSGTRYFAFQGSTFIGTPGLESWQAQVAISLTLPFTVSETGRYEIGYDFDAIASQPPESARVALEIDTIQASPIVLYEETAFGTDSGRAAFEVGLTADFEYQLRIDVTLSPDPDDNSQSFSLDDIELIKLEARELFVNASGRAFRPLEFSDIQSAVDAAFDGDTVTLRDGVFTGPGNRDVEIYGKSLTLRSESGDAGACIVDAGGGPGDESSVLLLGGLDAPNESVVRGITFQGGYQDLSPETLGGGVDVRWRLTDARFEDCVFRDNRALAGGGLEVNHSTSVDHGIDYEEGATFAGCVFHGNQATGAGQRGGGAVFVRNRSSVRFDACTFADNDAVFAGGAIATDTDATGSVLTLTRCLFFANTSGTSGSNEIRLDGGYGADLTGCMIDLSEVMGPVTESMTVPEVPQFCDAPGDDYSHCAVSPALPPFNVTGTLIGALGAGTCGACGEAIPVAAGGAGGYPDIQSAVAVAVNGDEIVLADGTYSGAPNRDTVVSTSLVIRSASNDPALCTIDAANTGGGGTGFEFEGAAAGFALEGVTIINADTQRRGGAIHVNGVSGSITNCRLLSNAATAGAAIGLQNGANVAMTDCVMFDNRATGAAGAGNGGGAIFIKDATATFERCVIGNSLASQSSGGAAWICGGTSAANAAFNRCTIAGNEATLLGDGLYTRNDGQSASVSLTESILWGTETGGITEQDAFVEAGTSLTSTCSMLRAGRIGGPGQRSIAGTVPGPPRFCDAAANDFALASNSRGAPSEHACSADWLGALSSPCGAIAVVLAVDPAGGGDHLTIGAALVAAVTGDTISLADATYTGSGNVGLLIEDKDLTLRSVSGDAALCIIDGEDVGGTWGVAIQGTGGGESTVRGITLRRFDTVSEPSIIGSALDARSGASVRVEDCVVESCESWAGAIGAAGGASLVVERSRIAGNESVSPDVGGAAVHVAGGAAVSLTLDRCVVVGNGPVTGIGAALGGAVFVASDVPAGSSRIDVVESTIAGNTANGAAAGLNVLSGAPVDIRTSILAGNGGTADVFALDLSADCTVFGTDPGGDSSPDTTNVLIDDPAFCPTGDYSLCDSSPVGALDAACGAGTIGAVHSACISTCDPSCTDPDQPGAPVAASVCGGVELSWSGDPAAEFYRVYVDGASSVTLPRQASMSHTHEVAPGDTQVRAYAIEAGVAGCASPISDAVNAAANPTPGAPAFTSAAAACDSVIVTWTTVAGADAYALYRVGDGTALVSVPDPGGAKTITQSLSTTETIELVVTAVLDGCESDPSGQIQISPHRTPDVPDGLSAAPLCRAVGLSWTQVPEADAYTVFRFEAGEPVEIATVVQSASPAYVDSVDTPEEREYAVAAVSNACESAPSTSVTQGPESAAPPELGSPASKSVVAQPIVFSWEIVPEALAYTLEVATSPAFGASVLWSSGSLIDTSVPLGILLDPDVAYWWRVSATTECALSRSADTFTTAAVLPITIGVGSVEDLDVVVPVTRNDENLLGVTALWRLGGETRALADQRSTCAEDGAGVFRCELPAAGGAVRGIELNLELSFDGFVVLDGSEAAPRRVRVVVDGVEALPQEPFVYRMLSTPLDGMAGSEMVDELLRVFGAEEADWKLRRWDPASAPGDPYERFGAGNAPVLSIGRAYWLVTRNAGQGGSWIASGESRRPSLVSSAPDVPDSFAVSLAPGWNMLGNPAGYPVTLAHAQLSVDGEPYADALASGVVGDIWLFSPCAGATAGGYVMADASAGTLAPWEGCWVENLTASSAALGVPAREVVETDPCARGPAREALLWEATIVATAGGRRASAVLAVAGERSSVRDAALPPPYPGKSLEMALLDVEGGDTPRRLFRDVKHPGDARVWRLELTGHESELELTWTISTTSGGAPDLVLEDDGGRTWRMRTTRALTLGPGRRVLTLTGDGSVTSPPARRGLEVIARPNPFASGTAFATYLPGAGRARVEVFDVAGRSVFAHAFVAESAGGRGITWDGRTGSGERLASGIYFVQLTFAPSRGASESTRRKLTIVR